MYRHPYLYGLSEQPNVEDAQKRCSTTGQVQALDFSHEYVDKRYSATRHKKIHCLRRPVDAPVVCQTDGENDPIGDEAAFCGLYTGYFPAGGKAPGGEITSAHRKYLDQQIRMAAHQMER